MLISLETPRSIFKNGYFELWNFTGFTFETGLNQQSPDWPHTSTLGFDAIVHNFINVENFSKPTITQSFQ